MTAEKKLANCYILQSQRLACELTEAQFNAQYWQGEPGFEPIIGGRGGSCMVDIDGQKAVLRRYHRGGAVGRMLRDQYLWLGKSATRPWREWRVLQRALADGLPVPEPIAACVCRIGLVYRAALIIAYLDDTETLTGRLQQKQLASDDWRQLGLLIKRLHTARIRHADLTSDNILIDSQNRFYLIDFDKARLMHRLDDWQWRPLFRLLRSIDKRDQNHKLHYSEDDWQALIDAYQS